jgi:hypothetical protein
MPKLPAEAWQTFGVMFALGVALMIVGFRMQHRSRWLLLFVGGLIAVTVPSIILLSSAGAN